MLSHVIGIALTALAFLVFGHGIVKRVNGKAFNPLPAFILILVALAYELFFSSGSFFARLPHILTDFGIGMIIASLYLAVRNANSKLLWVPGALALIVGSVMYVVSFGYDWVSKTMNNDQQLLVELGPDDEISEIEDILNRHGAEWEKAFPEVDLSEDEDLAQYYLVNVCEEQLENLKAALSLDGENVDQWEMNNPVYLIEPLSVENSRDGKTGFLANDPQLGKQWFADKLDYNDVYKFLAHHQPKKKVKLAIVDTGVDKDHEDLNSIYQKSGTDGDYDKHSHGSHCAGIAGAATNNGKGVGSLNWEGRHITISGYAALDDNGRGTDQRVSRAIIKAAEDGADVISMSLGGFSPFPPKAQKDAINYAIKKGATVVVAAGNSNDDSRRYSPANIPGVIVVSAADQNLNKASFSNINTKLKMPIAAPGVDILSTIPGGSYQAYSGTSMATPLVAGLIGMMKSYKPDLTNKEVYDILKNTGREVKDSGKIGKVVDPLKAIEAVQ
ncbi:MAG: S8 family serine peptidase [Bacteroidia bacterium]|nr:S8 family serine peptidase [Bacteroidia bacterium]